jgi:hypothetical protein
MKHRPWNQPWMKLEETVRGSCRNGYRLLEIAEDERNG